MAEHSGNAAGLNPVRQHLQTVLIPNEGTCQGYFTCRERRRRFGVLLPSLFAALLCSRYEAKLKRVYYTFITPSPAPSSLYKSISRKFNFMFCKIVFLSISNFASRDLRIDSDSNMELSAPVDEGILILGITMANI